jgi:hypothetical protein
MESDSDNKHKLILDSYFPNVITYMILSYIGRYGLQNDGCIYADYTYKIICGRNLIIQTEDGIIHDNQIVYKIPLRERVCNFISNYVVLLRNDDTGMYKIFNISLQQTITDLINIERDKLYCTLNSKYIIFRHNKNKNITIFDMHKMKFICDMIAPYQVTHESLIVNNILYITAHFVPIIFRYTILGECIGRINIVTDPEDILWSNSNVYITDNEIIIVRRRTIIFYDLEGNKLETLKINDQGSYNIYVNSTYVYLRYNNKIHKYMRVI